MNEHDFITWLRGFVETNDTPTEEQWDIIKKKLDSVFELPIKPYDPYPWKKYELWYEPYGPTPYWTDSTGED